MIDSPDESSSHETSTRNSYPTEADTATPFAAWLPQDEEGTVTRKSVMQDMAGRSLQNREAFRNFGGEESDLFTDNETINHHDSLTVEKNTPIILDLRRQIEKSNYYRLLENCRRSNNGRRFSVPESDSMPERCRRGSTTAEYLDKPPDTGNYWADDRFGNDLSEPLLRRSSANPNSLLSRLTLKIWGTSGFDQNVNRCRPRRLTGDFGVKTIGQTSSFIYLVNQIFGTGVIAIPNVVATSGWLPALIADGFVCVAATLGTLMMLRCMTLVKGKMLTA